MCANFIKNIFSPFLYRLEHDTVQDDESLTNSLEEAFIGSTDFELDSHEDDLEDTKCVPVNKNKLDINDNHEFPEKVQCNIENSGCDSLSEVMERLTLDTDKRTVIKNYNFLWKIISLDNNYSDNLTINDASQYFLSFIYLDLVI